MPRLKERDITVIRSFALEKSLVDRLEEEAHKRGMSVSKLVEMILMHSLGMQSSGESIQSGRNQQASVEDPPQVDPLVEIDIDEINKSLSKLEDKLRKAETTRNRSELRKTEQAYLLGMWNDIKKRYMKIRRQIPKQKTIEISKKLAELKKRIDKLA
jgi:predicted  nucleic acid-binding Zn-ribbon protein